MRILYIEDNAADANLVSRYVRTTPHQLIIVRALDEVYSALEEPVDLVLVDLLLNQQRSGFDVARMLRDNDYECPIIAVTALTTPADISAAKRAGFNEVLPKPFQITELASVIERYVG